MERQCGSKREGRAAALALASLLFAACSSDGGSSYDFGVKGGPPGGPPDLQFVFPMMCHDKVTDGDETDVDCGGSCPPCAAGKACLHPKDCMSGVCANNRCAGPSCSDNIKNGAETDIDCGGPTCPKCAQGKMCLGAGDCLSANCINNLCQASQCTDNVKDGSETDVDCGGGVCPPCAAGKMCLFPTDCQGNMCVNNVCMGDCVGADLQSDPLNCGTCGNVCPNVTPACVGGTCVMADMQIAGSYAVGMGPAAGSNPTPMSCREACAKLFGGTFAMYSCSTSQNGINHTAFVDGFNDPSHCAGSPVQEDFKKGGNYSCNVQGCSYSAFVSDHMQCANATNWCFK
jgi:hypothetical protein